MGHEGDRTNRTQILQPLTDRPKAASGEAVLVVLHGPNIGRRFPLSSGEYVIGRLAENGICLDTDFVSRRHARVYSAGLGDDAQWYLEDLESTNGSFVNEQRVHRCLLRNGDIIQVGTASLKFLAGGNIEAAYHEEIYRMTILDSLTGVHNKRAFLEFLDREISRASRHAASLSLVMFDIDFFKKVNDTHGHLAGDAVLKEVCRRLKPRVRKEDLFARYGGEEFACVLPDTTLPGAVAFAESLRQLIERDPVHHDGKAMPVTISLGVALLASSDTPTELIRRADERLYEAKRAGRNRVVS